MGVILINMKNGIFLLIVTIIRPKGLTLCYPVQPETPSMIYLSTMRCRYSTVHFLRNIQKRYSYLPVRARYGVSFVDPASDWYSTLVRVIIYVKSYNITPHYNDTRRYVYGTLFHKKSILPYLNCSKSRSVVCVEKYVKHQYSRKLPCITKQNP